MAEGYWEREKDRQEQTLNTAWLLAAWSRSDHKLPEWSEIEKHFNKSVTAPKEQTPEQMLAMAKVLNAAFGGTVVEI